MIDGYNVKGGTIEIVEDGKLYAVANWTTEGECRWMKHFKTLEQAKVELERFRHLKVKD